MSTRTSFPAQQLRWRSEVQDAEIGGDVTVTPDSCVGTCGANTRLRARWGWRGAHPGAGVTTLARELGGADLGMSNVANLPILVVCRSSADGLIAAQRLAAHELSETPSWHCLGLVVVADDRGPLAKALAELAALVDRRVPQPLANPVGGVLADPANGDPVGDTADNETSRPCRTQATRSSLSPKSRNDKGAAMTPSTHLITKVVLIDVVSPGTGVQPPGTQGIVTVMGYVAWVVCALCVTGVLLVAGRMALHHRQGIGGEHLSGLAWVLAACILVAAGSGVVGALI